MTTKGMSPLRSLARSSPRKPQSQEVNSNENAYDSGTGLSGPTAPCRAPLCPIPLPSQFFEGTENADSILKGKPDASTPRAKSKFQQRSENPGGTPEKLAVSGMSAVGRNRFGWHQPRYQAVGGTEKETSSTGLRSSSPTGKHGQERSCADEGRDIQTPLKLSRSSSGSEASHSSAGVGLEGQVNLNFGQPNLSRAGASNHSTPRSARSIRPATNDPEASGGSQPIGTPTRSVSRTLKYTANNGPSSSGTASTRSGLLGTRSAGPLFQPVRSVQPHSPDYQSVDVPYFELEEDPSFWNDHNVQVLIRCRPLNSSEIASQGYSRCLKQETSHTVTWIGQPESRFTFDHVACEKITQEKLFKIAGIPMIDNCMSGYNSCMFAYGQTGSGKTHTMLGDIGELEQRPSDNRGMTPRIFEYLFRRIMMEEENRKNECLKFTCKCSFLEIYNEQITDLLEPSSTNLQMREDLKKGVYVENLSEVEVKSVQDVVFLLLQGAANRRVAATNMNQESSRSHSVFTCVLESKWESESMTNIRFGRLNLVDLAGSERQKSSGAEGERLKEAANINKSLSTLGLVIMILVDVAHGKQRHVPYRDSKLTFLLQDSLGGNSKTTIIANVSPSVSCASETLSTLKFAQRAKFIRNNAIVNEDASGDVFALRLQIQQLKDELKRLSRQSISRIPFSSETGLPEVSGAGISNGSVAIAALSSRTFEIGENDEAALKKVKALEAVVAGSLRREQAADNTAKRLAGEIEQLNCLVRQREDDSQFNKMMLRFREDKIRRLEATIDGVLSEEACRSEENHALREELHLLRGRLDKNPELTRFATENIRLMEELQRLQDFYEAGEREILLEEISSLRDQLLEFLEAKLAGDELVHQQTNGKVLELKDPNENLLIASKCEEENTTSELKSLLKEKEEQIQWEMARADHLNQKLVDAMGNIELLGEELKKNKEALEAAKGLAERLHLTEASLAAAQETAASAQATVKQIRLETEDIALQQRQSFSEIQEATTVWRLQELQLRSQLEDAQKMIKEMSVQKSPADLESSAGNEPKPDFAEMVMQLQLELKAVDCLIQEERAYREEAEQRSISMSMQLEEAEERSERLRTQLEEAEERSERLSTQLEEAEEEELEISKRLLESVENLNHQKLVVESLENQALLSVNEINHLQAQNINLTKGLKERENELQVLTGCVVFLQSELQRELEIRVLEMDADDHNSNLKDKLERTRKALQQAQQLNDKLQNEQDSFRALEHEKELVRADAETETTEAITLLQSELVSLCEDHKITQQREVKAEQKVVQLKMDLMALRSELNAFSEKNAQLSSLYENAMKEKDAEISKLTQDWEMAATNLIECLSEGNQALDDAAQEIDRMAEECPSQSNQASNHKLLTSSEEENLLEVLQKRLMHAQKLAKQTENKVRVLSDATLTIAEIQREEKTNMHNDLEALSLLLEEKSLCINCLQSKVDSWKGKALKAEKMLLAACIIIDRLSDNGDELAVTKKGMQTLADETAMIIAERENEVHCLQLQKRTCEALLEEKEIVISNNERLIQSLHGQVKDINSQKEKAEHQLGSLKCEQDMIQDKLDSAEKEVQKLKLQVETAEQTCMRLFTELCQANKCTEDKVVMLVEIQLLECLLSSQENLAREEMLEDRSIFSQREADYEMLNKQLDERVRQLEGEKTVLLDGLEKERNLALQLGGDLQNTHQNVDTLTIKFEHLEKDFIAKHTLSLLQSEQLQESRSKAICLERENACLVDELNSQKICVAQLQIELGKVCSRSSVNLQAAMESWSGEKFVMTWEAELKKNLLDHQVCLLEEDLSLCKVRLEAAEKVCLDQNIRLQKESMTWTNRINEVEVLVQDLNGKLQISDMNLQMSQLQAKRADQKVDCLSIHVEHLSEELAADKFAIVVEKDIIKQVLEDQVQLHQEIWLQLELEVREAKQMSTELVREKTFTGANMETLKLEVSNFRVQNRAQQEASESLTRELLECNDQLQLLKTQAEQAQERCACLAFNLENVQERLTVENFILIFEKAILKELFVYQEEIVQKETLAFNLRIQVLEGQLHECLEKISCLESENTALTKQVESFLAVAQESIVELKSLNQNLEYDREDISEADMGNKILREGSTEYRFLVEELRGDCNQSQSESTEMRCCHEQEVDRSLKTLQTLKEELQRCGDQVGIIKKERAILLSKRGEEKTLCAQLKIEIDSSHGEIRKIQSDCLQVNKCMLESLGLARNSGEVLTEALLAVKQLKAEKSLLLDKIQQEEVEISSLQAELQQTCESLEYLGNMHSSCQSNLQQILERERNQNREELLSKESTVCQLQSKLSHFSEMAEMLDRMYKDVCRQLQSKDLEIEKLHEQQQESFKMFSVMQQEKKGLQEDLEIRTRESLQEDTPCQSADADDSHLIEETQLKQLTDSLTASLLNVNELEVSNLELKAEVERQRHDMEILQYELEKSCDIVSEVKGAHSKTLEVLHEKEKELLKFLTQVKEMRATMSQLEQDNLHLRKQNVTLLQEVQKLSSFQLKLEEALYSFRAVQEKALKSIEAVEIRENRILSLHDDVECFLASKSSDGESENVLGVYEGCQLILGDMETLVEFGSKVAEDLENARGCLKHMELVLDDKVLQIKDMSRRIVDLERDKECLQEEKNRREAAIKVWQLRSQQHEHVQDVLKATHEGSEKLMEAVQGHEMKLTSLQRKIERIAEWLSQEVGYDTKVAFTEGCELVLCEVEKEVETCRQQADLAWKKFELVLDEKTKIEGDLLKKDQLIKSLQHDASLLDKHAAVAMQGNEIVHESNSIIRQLEGEISKKQMQINSLEREFRQLQHRSNSVNSTLANMEETILEHRKSFSLLETDNLQLKSQVQELIARNSFYEEDLEDKQHAIQVLEMELLELSSLIEQGKAFSLDHMNHDLNQALKERDVALKERDQLHAESVVLNEQLEMAQQLVEEHEAIAVEARQAAETSKTCAEQKEEEAKLLERSVEELESTVNALETQVGVLKSDAERQRLMREDIEMELQALRHQMSQMQALQLESEVQHGVLEQKQRDLEMRGMQLMEAEDKIEILERQCIEKDEQIRKCKNDIMELLSGAERQASEHHQILRTLENMAEQRSSIQAQTNPKLVDKNAAKPRGSGSPFKCIGSGLSQQMSFEIDEELSCNRQKIEELEALASSRQKEIFMLNIRLAEAESMTHDVIRDLVGVKLDITNYATSINHQQVQKIAEKCFTQKEQAKEKEKELLQLKTQLNEFIEERESWLEEINRRQAEMMTARVAAEKLRQRDQLLSTENEVLKTENASQRKRLVELEEEVNKLSGQQNLQQRIHHHAKIKEENNCLRMNNEDLATRLRRSELLLNRVSDELARYRAADGKTPHIDLEEEQKLEVRLQEVEEEKIQLAQELLTLCTSVLQVAGVARPARGVDHTVAAEALKQLQDRLDTTERELSDMKLKNKIEWEKRRLSELRSLHSPVLSTSFAAAQKSASPPHSSR